MRTTPGGAGHRPPGPGPGAGRYTAIDDGTRLRVLRAYPRNDQQSVIAFIDHVLSNL